MKKILISGLVATILAGCSVVSSNTKNVDTFYKQKKLNFSNSLTYKNIGNYKLPDSTDTDNILLALYNVSIERVKIILDKSDNNRLSCRIDFTTKSLDNTIDSNFLNKLDLNHDYNITMDELMTTYIGICNGSILISSLR